MKIDDLKLDLYVYKPVFLWVERQKSSLINKRKCDRVYICFPLKDDQRLQGGSLDSKKLGSLSKICHSGCALFKQQATARSMSSAKKSKTKKIDNLV